jgi:hypothetical protein
MSKKASQWLIPQKQFEGQKPGKSLVKWLNDPRLDPKFLEKLLFEAQAVFRGAVQYGNLEKLNVARNQKKLPPAFWDSYTRLNDTLAAFTYAPQIDLQEFPEERVSWILVAEKSPIALLSVQVRCVLQLIEQGAILKIRRCQQCKVWFFARSSNQEYCKTSCRIKHLTGTEKFKKHRREFMRKYNKLQKSGKVK